MDVAQISRVEFVIVCFAIKTIKFINPQNTILLTTNATFRAKMILKLLISSLNRIHHLES